MTGIILFLILFIAGAALVKEHSSKLSTAVGAVIAFLGASWLIMLLV